MRNAMGAIGLAAAAVVVALVARYGYVTGDTFGDAALTAFSFAAIAIVGLIGPAAALRLFWSSLRAAKLFGVLVAMLACAALLATLGNSLGAVAKHAERVKVAEVRSGDEAALAQITAERATMHFTPTTDAAVASAREAMMAADTARRAECDGGRGKHCEEVAADLGTKRDAFAAVLKDRAATQQADRLDAEAASVRARLNAKPAAHVEEPKAAPLGLLIKLPDAGAVTERRIAAIVTGELLIVLMLVAWVWRRWRPSTTEAIHQAVRGIPITAANREAAAGDRGRTSKREPAASGDVAIFVQDCMRRAGGENVELRTLYSRFLEWCDAQQLVPLPPKKFSEAFVARCAEADIDVRCEGANVLFLDVKLTPIDYWHR